VFTVTELHAARTTSAKAPAAAEIALRGVSFTFGDPRAGKVGRRVMRTGLLRYHWREKEFPAI